MWKMSAFTFHQVNSTRLLMVLTQLPVFLYYILVKHTIIMCMICDLSVDRNDLCGSIRKRKRMALLPPHLDLKQMEFRRLFSEKENVLF